MNGNSTIRAVAAALLCVTGAAGSAEYQLEEIGVFGPYDGVSDLVCSDDGSSWAFWADKGGKRYVVINGEEKGPYGIGRGQEKVRSLGDDITFSADGTRVAFWDKETSDYYVIVDGSEYGPYDETDHIYFSRDGASWALRGAKENGDYLVIDGEEKGPYEEISLRYFYSAAEWATKAKSGVKEYAIINGIEFGPFDLVSDTRLTADEESHWAITFRNNHDWYLMVDGKKWGPYGEAFWVYFYNGGRDWKARVSKSDGIYILINGELSGPYHGVNEWELDDTPFAVTRVRKSDGLYFVVNGAEHGPYEKAITADSDNEDYWGYSACSEGRWYVYLNDKEYGPYDNVISPPYISEDGHIIYCIDQGGVKYLVGDTEKTEIREIPEGDEYFIIPMAVSPAADSWVIHCLGVKRDGNCTYFDRVFHLISQCGKISGPYEVESFHFLHSRDFTCYFFEPLNEDGAWFGIVDGVEFGPYALTAFYRRYPRRLNDYRFFEGLYTMETLPDSKYRLSKWHK